MAPLHTVKTRQGRKLVRNYCWQCRENNLYCDQGRPACSTCRDNEHFRPGYEDEDEDEDEDEAVESCDDVINAVDSGSSSPLPTFDPDELSSTLRARRDILFQEFDIICAVLKWHEVQRNNTEEYWQQILNTQRGQRDNPVIPRAFIGPAESPMDHAATMPMFLTTKEIQQIFVIFKTMPLKSALVLIYQARGDDRLAEGATSFKNLLSSLDMYDPDYGTGLAVSNKWFSDFLDWQDEALNLPHDMVQWRI
ncbi:Hypothetical protein D9617_48g089420 [Elsinoe fawcettii]|nr:Hypothetical protein D9617_48g089420 [Elsinoe fawcettii]